MKIDPEHYRTILSMLHSTTTPTPLQMNEKSNENFIFVFTCVVCVWEHRLNMSNGQVPVDLMMYDV